MPVSARISADERETLETLAADAYDAAVPRGHLEKLARLELIEPCGAGVCLSPLGRGVLGK